MKTKNRGGFKTELITYNMKAKNKLHRKQHWDYITGLHGLLWEYKQPVHNLRTFHKWWMLFGTEIWSTLVHCMILLPRLPIWFEAIFALSIFSTKISPFLMNQYVKFYLAYVKHISHLIQSCYKVCDDKMFPFNLCKMIRFSLASPRTSVWAMWPEQTNH